VIPFLFSLSALDALYLPLMLSAALTMWLERSRLPAAQSLAMLAAYLFGFLAVRPLPLWPVGGAIGWLPFAVIGGAALGILALLPRGHRWLLPPALIAVMFGLILLIGERAYNDLVGPSPWMAYGAGLLVGLLLFLRLYERRADAAGGRLLLALALGLAIVALAAGSRIGIHALTLAAVIAGALFTGRYTIPPWSAAASLTAGMGVFATGALLALSSAEMLLPVALLLAMLPFQAALDYGWPARRSPALGESIGFGASILAALVSLRFP